MLLTINSSLSLTAVSWLKNPKKKTDRTFSPLHELHKRLKNNCSQWEGGNWNKGILQTLHYWLARTVANTDGLSLLVKAAVCTGVEETRSIWHFTEERRSSINLFAEKKLHSVTKIKSNFLDPICRIYLALLGGWDGKQATSSFYLYLFCYPNMRGDWELPQNHAISISKTCYSLMIFERRQSLIQPFVTPLYHSLICLHS